MPEAASEITPEESLKYKREIMVGQFYRIREAMHKGNPGTKANFNVPFFKPAEPMWVDHPMLNECDQLIAESSNDVVDWLLKIRKPHQRVMTTIIGIEGNEGGCDPNSWKKWYEAGCDFFGYAHATPPDLRATTRPMVGTETPKIVAHSAWLLPAPESFRNEAKPAYSMARGSAQ